MRIVTNVFNYTSVKYILNNILIITIRLFSYCFTFDYKFEKMFSEIIA